MKKWNNIPEIKISINSPLFKLQSSMKYSGNKLLSWQHFWYWNSIDLLAQSAFLVDLIRDYSLDEYGKPTFVDDSKAPKRFF